MEQTAPGPSIPPRVASVAEQAAVAQELVARPITGPVPMIEEPAPARRHHTMIPRTLCFAGQLMWIAIPGLVLLLADAGRVEWDSRGVPQLDEDGRRMVALVAIASVGAYLLGWVWWVTVATLNARHVSRRTTWPGAALLVLVLQMGTLAAGQAVHLENDVVDAGVTLLALAIVVGAHFMLLGSLRRSANSIRGQQAPWTRLIVIPVAALAFNAIGAFFVGFISQEMTMGIIGAQVALLVWYVLSFYQAMSSFDRACIGRSLMGQDDQAFAKFLKHRRP